MSSFACAHLFSRRLVYLVNLAAGLLTSRPLLAIAFYRVPAICTAQIIEFIDATGDGAGNPLDIAEGVEVDGNVYVGGRHSDNVFKIPADLTPVELMTFSIE